MLKEQTQPKNEKDSGKKRLATAGKIRYWFDVAKVTGDERITEYDDDPNDANRSVVTKISNGKVSGWAMDAGLSWRTKFKVSEPLICVKH